VDASLLLGFLNWAARALAIPGVKSSWSFGKKRWWRRKFKKVFGQAEKEYFLACGMLQVNPLIRQFVRNADPQLANYPFVKPTRLQMQFSAERVASGSEVRALAYIGDALKTDGGLASRVVPDDLIESRLDIDFVSFGAVSNLMTLATFENPSNQLASFDSAAGTFVSKVDGQPLYRVPDGYDCGIILRIHPNQFPRRTWIVCAGLGEWGTSGSAWFLAYRWREIVEKLKDVDQFVCVIQVRLGQDESATLQTYASK
jgi:hypothetical protein